MKVHELRTALKPYPDDCEVRIVEREIFKPCAGPNDDGPGIVLRVPDGGTYSLKKQYERALNDLRMALKAVLDGERL